MMHRLDGCLAQIWRREITNIYIFLKRPQAPSLVNPSRYRSCHLFAGAPNMGRIGD